MTTQTVDLMNYEYRKKDSRESQKSHNKAVNISRMDILETWYGSNQ